MAWEPKDWVAVAALGATLGTWVFSYQIAKQGFDRSLARDQRDALFKALDVYLKVRELRSKAETSHTHQDWEDYYRALFDLQWSEFQVWRNDALPDQPYKAWLLQHHKMYETDEKPLVAPTPAISYRTAWADLLNSGYFLSTDSFVAHMKAVHEGKVALAMRSKLPQWLG